MVRFCIRATFAVSSAFVALTLAPTLAGAEQPSIKSVKAEASGAASAGSAKKSHAVLQREKKQAESLWKRGRELFDENQYDEALGFFLQAEQLNPTPAYAYSVAKAHVQIGKFVEAKARFETVMNADPSEVTSPGDFEAQAAAPVELAKLNPKISKLSIIIEEAPAHKAIAMIDGAEVPHYGKPVEVNPGRHVVNAHVPGGEVRAVTVTVEQGATEDVALTLLQSKFNPRVSVAWPILSMVVGGLVVAGGGAGLALSKDSNNVGLQALSGVGIGMGGLGVGGGLVLFGYRYEGPSGGSSGAASLRPAVSNRFIGVTGSF